MCPMVTLGNGGTDQADIALDFAVLSYKFKGGRRDHAHELCYRHSFQSQAQLHPG